jgi:TolB-like protein/Tfp pilus assembly protein PilF
MLLLRDGKVVALRQRSFTLLAALAAAPGAVVKAALMEAAWPDVTVEDGNLAVQIAALRKALGQRPDGEDWIVTVPRVGYRLLRDMGPHHELGGLTLPLLAILPFHNLGGSEDERHVADGLVQDLVNALGRFRDFELVDQKGGEQGRESRGRYVIEGGVRRTGGQLRITMQLVDGETGRHLWTDRLDHADDDILAAQDEVAYRVCGGAIAALQFVEIERAKLETIPSAYTLYLQGVSKFKMLTPAGHAEGFELIRRALEIDPRYARALSHGAFLLGNNHRMDWPAFTADDRATCATFIERAELGVSDDARVLAECSGAMLDMTREYRRALELSRRACAINPFSMQAFRHFGVASIHCGDLGEAYDAFQHAFRRSPQGLLAPVSLTGLAHVCIIRGDYEEALGWAEKSLAISARYDATYWMLIAANAHLGRLDAARNHLAELRKRVPNETVAVIKAGQPDYDPSRIAPILEGLCMAGMP